MKRWMIVLVLFTIFLILANSQDFARTNDHPEQTNIILRGDAQIQLPNIVVNTPNANWTFTSGEYPIFETQNLSGTVEGPNDLAGSTINFCPGSFDIKNLFDKPKSSTKSCWPVKLNDSSIGSFSIPGINGGFYLLNITDENKSASISIMPLVVTFENLTVNITEEIRSGDSISAKVSTSSVAGNNSYFAAILVPRQDYVNSKIVVSGNSSANLLTNISIGNKSAQIDGLPRLSSDLIYGLMSILPSNSTAAFQESNQSEIDFFMITDSSWEKGEYILTTAVYQPRIGLTGLNQETIEIK
ncbi:MAG: hypothetical protein MUO26_07560 [Methanotrichaceae archaeon]|nr:hypothetical protein [Methanotrichaceae archaeon]